VDRTIIVKLKPTDEQIPILHETMAQFTQAFNRVCSVGFEQKIGNAYTLHKLTYRDCKNALPDLVSDLHIQARQKASESVRSALALIKKGRRVGCPQSLLCPPRYNLHTFRVYWDMNVISMSTTSGKLKIPFSLPSYATYAIRTKTSTADLIHRKGKFFFHIVINLPDIEFTSNNHVLGIDLGVTHPAVSSDNCFHGNRHQKEVVKRIFRLKRDLQANGSKSAKRHLRSLAGREQRFRRDCDHVISKSIITGITPGTTIVLENLTNIRNRIKVYHGEASRRMHSWSFEQLRTFIQYKAELAGCQVVLIDPRKTSQRCSYCGSISRNNRRTQSSFICCKCSFHLNADLNASRNIRDKFLVGWGISSSDALPSTSVSFPASVSPRNKLTTKSASG
jgi:IS605 OrfB family transposase